LSDELKSAVELALEKLDREMGENIPKLSEDQRDRIAEIRKKYQAKIAEAEISAQTEIRKELEAGNSEGVAEAEKRLANEKQCLQSERDQRISKIREE
jgi:hypothetical protein